MSINSTHKKSEPKTLSAKYRNYIHTDIFSPKLYTEISVLAPFFPPKRETPDVIRSHFLSLYFLYTFSFSLSYIESDEVDKIKKRIRKKEKQEKGE